VQVGLAFFLLSLQLPGWRWVPGVHWQSNSCCVVGLISLAWVIPCSLINSCLSLLHLYGLRALVLLLPGFSVAG
jgi:hypothetical protein